MAQQLGNTARNAAGQIVGSVGLTDQQQAFVDAYLANGGRQGRAAEAAGYAQPDVAGYRLVRLPHVNAAIQEAQDRRLAALLARAVDEMDAILSSPERDKDTRALKIQAFRALQARQEARERAKAGDADKPGKPLNSMTISQLEKFINDWNAANANVAQTIDVTPAKPLET